MKAVVFTLGCKVNAYESSCLLNGLKSIGYEVSDCLEYADLYILNTCAVTNEAEKKSRQAISRIKKYNPNAKIIVTGCASQNNPDAFISKSGVTLVTGAANKDRIIELIDKQGINIDCSNGYYEKYLPSTDFKTRVYLKVEDGCNNFCSYCLIPYLRGRVRSRSIESIKKQLNVTNSKEVVITGINLSAYNYNGFDLADLITSLANYPFRFRLGSLEENVVSEKLLIATKKLNDFAPHFHLSLQSGSDRVLKDMNRHYTKQDFINSVKLIRRYYPDAAITTDIIVGFPTETDTDFLDTLNLCKTIDFADIHCFVYSPRKGTRAFLYEQLPTYITDERLKQLLAIKTSARNSFANNFIGRHLSVICEEQKGEYCVGYSQNYIRCYIKNAKPDNCYVVKAVCPFEDGLYCEF